MDTLVAAANYSYTRAEFAALRRRLVQAGAEFAAGVMVFASAANPPEPAAAGNPAPASIPAVTGYQHSPLPGTPHPGGGAARPAGERSG